MSVAAKISALLEVLTVEDIAAMRPVDRRLLARRCLLVATLADPEPPAACPGLRSGVRNGHKSGILAQLPEGTD